MKDSKRKRHKNTEIKMTQAHTDKNNRWTQSQKDTKTQRGQIARLIDLM